MILSETFDQHLSDLQEGFDRFRAAGLKLSPGKCTFAQTLFVFLGHEISKNGISPPSDLIDSEQFPNEHKTNETISWTHELV